MTNKETNTQNLIMLEMSQAGMLPYRQMVGSFRPIYNPETIIKIGVPGMADIGGVMPVRITQDMVGKTIGVAVNVEVKTSTGKQRDNQLIWENSWKQRNGIYIVSRDPDTVIKDLKDAVEEQFNER